MRYGRELLQKPIVSADKNEKLGRIHGYVLDPDERRVAAFVLEQAAGDKSFSVVPFSATKSIYSDAVIVENLPGELPADEDSRMMELLMKDVALAGAHAITETGMLAGRVSDFAFSERTGELLSLRLEAEPGFPETFDVRKVIKIAKERIIVSGSLYDEREAAKPRPQVARQERPAERAVYAAEPERGAEKAAAAVEQQVPAAGAVSQEAARVQAQAAAGGNAGRAEAAGSDYQRPDISTTPRVDAARFQGLFDQLRKDIISETETIYNSLFKEQLRSSFQEAVRLLMDRINSLDPEKHFDKFRERVMDELRAGFADEVRLAVAQAAARDEAAEIEGAIEREPARAVEDVIEEKLEAALAPRFEAVGARVGEVEKVVMEIAEGQKAAAGDVILNLKQAAAEAKELLSDAAAGSAGEVAKSAAGVDAALKDGLGKMLESLAEEGKARAGLEGKVAAVAEGFSAEVAALRGELESLAAGLAEKIAEQGEVRSEMSAGRASAAEEVLIEIEKIKQDIVSIKDEITAELADAVGTGNAELRELVRETAKANGAELAALARELAKPGQAEAAEAAAKMRGVVSEGNAELRESVAAMAREGREGVEKIQENVTNTVRAGYGELRESIAGAVKAGHDELREGLREAAAAGSGEIKEIIGKLSENIAGAEALGESVEKIRESVKEAVEAVSAGNGALRESVESIAAAAAAGREELLGGVTEALKAGNDELRESVREAVAAGGEDVKALIGNLAERIPGADALERTADKLKYELTLILPELLQKNFEELRHKADEIAGRLAAPEDSGLVAEKIIEAVEKAVAGPVEAAGRSMEEKLSAALAKVELVSEIVETQRSEFREGAAGISERTASLVREDLAALRETVDFLKQQPGLLEDMLAGSTEQVSERIREAVEGIREGFVSAAAADGGVKEKLGAMEAALAVAAEKLSEEQKAGRELLEKIQLSVEDRLRLARTEMEDVLRGELARHADSSAGISDELRKAVRDVEMNVIGLSEEFKKTDPEELAGKLLGEISSFAGQSVRHEDVAELKKWMETTISGMLESVRGEAQEKLGSTLATLRNIREETALDVESFKREMAKCHEGMREALHNQIDFEIQRLQASFDIDALKKDVKGIVDGAVNDVRDRVDRNMELFKSDFQQAARDGVDLKELVSAAMGRLPETVGTVTEEIRKITEKVEQISRAGSDKADSAAEKIEELTSGRMEKFETMAARFEKSLRESSDGILDYVDRRIGERDENIEGAFLKTAEAIEELAKRAPRADFGEMLSGRLFGGIFGAQKPEPPRSIQAPGVKKKAAGASGIVEAGQVRRLSYLIGKTLVRDILDSDGSEVARAGDKVGEETIRACRDAHRVLDLIRAVDLGAE